MANNTKTNANSKKGGGDITLDELANICGAEFENADLYDTISQERENALNSYNSEYYGNEEAGLSKFVTSDVRDVIEWTLPQIMDVFYGSDMPVVFLPENAEDVEQAEIESKYCENVLESQNEGFMILYTWFKDALMQKNGTVKAYWDEKVIEEREEYADKTLEEFYILNNDEEFVIDELTINLGTGEAEKDFTEDEFVELLGTFTDQIALQEITSNARVQIVGRRTNDVSQVKIENIAPERFFISRYHKSPNPQTADYTCEVYTKTRSEMIEEGFDEDLVMSLDANYEGLTEFGSENVNRYKKEGTGQSEGERAVHDPARDELILFEHYIRVDWDGDGITEMRQVITNGPSGEVISNEPVDRNIYHSLTPYINPHKFYGRSLADNMMDLQKMKTQIVRNIMDSLTYSTIPRKKVKGSVNTDDLLKYIPGGIIRMGQDGSVEDDLTPFVGADGLSVLGQVDSFRAERSGFSRDTVGLNPDALANSTNLVGSMILGQSQLLVKMIASIFANTGMNSLMLHIRELATKYEKKERIFDIAGNFVQVDPRAWRKKRSSQVRTGIGHSAKMEKISVLTEFLGLQEKIAAQQGGIEGPLTSADGMYSLIKDIGKTSGVKDCEKYFRNPAEYQPPEPQPSVAEMAFKLEQEKARNEQTSKEADKVTDQAQFNQKLEFDREKFEAQKEWEQEKFEREMLYKYGESARQGVREFLNATDVLEEANFNDTEENENNPQDEEEQAPDDDQDDQEANQ